MQTLRQKQLKLTDNSVGNDLQSFFQIAAVTRPLLSVGKICDEGHSITYNNICAVVPSKDGEELCRFHREGPGDLYVSKIKPRSPLGFENKLIRAQLAVVLIRAQTRCRQPTHKTGMPQDLPHFDPYKVFKSSKMSDSEIADTGDVPGVPTNIPFTEEIANTGEPENVGT